MAWKARINDFLFLVLKVDRCVADDYCTILMVLNDIYYLIGLVFQIFAPQFLSNLLIVSALF